MERGKGVDKLNLRGVTQCRSTTVNDWN